MTAREISACFRFHSLRLSRFDAIGGAMGRLTGPGDQATAAWHLRPRGVVVEFMAATGSPNQTRGGAGGKIAGCYELGSYPVFPVWRRRSYSSSRAAGIAP